MSKNLSYAILVCLMLVGCDDKAAALAPGSINTSDAQVRDAATRTDTSMNNDMFIQAPDGALLMDMAVQTPDAEPMPLMDAEIELDVGMDDMMLSPDASPPVDAAVANTDMGGMPNEVDQCIELFNCITDCGADAQCASACRTSDNELVVAQLLTLESCLTSNDCYSDNQINEACANSNCRADFLGCFGEDSLPPLESETTGCGMLAACDTECGEDTQCRGACAEMATAQDRLIYADYVRCAMTDGPESCTAEYEACYGTEPELTCNQVFDCINGCAPGDRMCAPTCIDNASNEAIEALDARSDCLSNSACDTDDYACRLSDCETSLTACFGETIIPNGMNSCSALNECLNLCPASDPACSNTCFAGSSPDGYNEFFALIYCGQDNGCNESDDPDVYSACLAANCSQQSNICFEDTVGQGTLTCSEMYDCVETCPEGDALCTAGCVENVSPEGLVQARAFEGCFGETGCPDNDYACELQTCATEFLECFGSVGVPSGTGNCDELNTCLGLCNADDDACANDCIGQSAPNEYNEFITLAMCAENSGCNGNSACINSVCSNEITTCQTVDNNDALLTCSEYNDCLGACNGDLFCQLACDETASGQALSDHGAIFDCAALNFCTSLTGELDLDCVDQNCADELATCFGEPVTPSGTGSCPELFACIGPCADGDTECVNACIISTSQAGFDAAVDYSDCSNEFCPNLTDAAYAECIDSNCAFEEFICLAN
jgi:hypothetical protein